MIKPKCFTWEQWQTYYHVGGRAYSICQDCTPDFQKEMLEVNQCEHPEVTFHKVGRRWVFDHNGPDQIEGTTE